MSGGIVLIVAAAVACFNAGLHWYTHVATYPLFAKLPSAHFVSYHGAYQRRLPFAIYAPYTAALLSTVLLLVSRPATMPASQVWMALALHLTITGISLGMAVPLHRRLDAEGNLTPLVARLVRVNALRLAAAVLACGVLVLNVILSLRQ